MKKCHQNKKSLQDLHPKIGKNEDLYYNSNAYPHKNVLKGLENSKTTLKTGN